MTRIAGATIALTLVLTSAISQKKHLVSLVNEYDALRYSLHSKLDQTNPMQITPGMASVIQDFLNENREDIIEYRNYILGKYEREDIESDHLYVDDKELGEEIRSNQVFLGLLGQFEAKKPGEKSVPELMEFLAVDPMLVLNSISSHIQSMVFMKEDISTQEIAMQYARSFIGGRYISTHKKDKNNWSVKIYEYHYYTQYSFNVESGQASIDTIAKRKDKD